MPRNDFLTRPAPESEDDLEVPGQPFLGLLGILSEYYKCREPNNKQGRALGNALKYLYRVKKKEVNGTVDENFGLEILDAVEKVVVNKHPPKETPTLTPTQGEPSTADQTSSKEPTRALVAEPPPDTFSDFGFSSSSSSSDELGSKINDLVAMVKSKVKKKKKKKKRKISDQDSDEAGVSEPIPKLKIRFGKQRSGSEDLSSNEDASRPTTDSPMKLTIKLGAVGGSPLLPPPPSLTLHKPSSSPPSSPKYEPDLPSAAIMCPDEKTEEKPPIKLTLRMAQPMRNAKGWISPRTEQLVNYIDDVTTFINESAKSLEVAQECSTPEQDSPLLPEPPQLKLAPTSPSKHTLTSVKPAPLTTKIKLPTSVCRKRKRESSPKHSTVVLSPKEVIEEVTKPAVPALKLRKPCLSSKVAESPSPVAENLPVKKSRVASASSSDTPSTKAPKTKRSKRTAPSVEKKEYWKCGIFSNSLKQNTDCSIHDELDFRSNILPIYCGINYLRKQSMFTLPYDLHWMKENRLLPKKEPTPKSSIKELEIMLSKTIQLPKLSECEYVFDEHIDKPKQRGRKSKRGKKKSSSCRKKRSADSESLPKSPDPPESVSSPCDSPGLVIQSDCDSPLPLDSDPLSPGLQTQTSSEKHSDGIDSPFEPSFKSVAPQINEKSSEPDVLRTDPKEEDLPTHRRIPKTEYSESDDEIKETRDDSRAFGEEESETPAIRHTPQSDHELMDLMDPEDSSLAIVETAIDEECLPKIQSSLDGIDSMQKGETNSPNRNESDLPIENSSFSVEEKVLKADDGPNSPTSAEVVTPANLIGQQGILKNSDCLRLEVRQLENEKEAEASSQRSEPYASAVDGPVDISVLPTSVSRPKRVTDSGMERKMSPQPIAIVKGIPKIIGDTSDQIILTGLHDFESNSAEAFQSSANPREPDSITADVASPTCDKLVSVGRPEHNTAARLDSATVRVTARPSSVDTPPGRTHSTSQEQEDTDSDISFNQDQDTVIEHQSQRAIQL